MKKDLEDAINKEIRIGGVMVAYVLASDEPVTIGFGRTEDNKFSVAIAPVKRPTAAVMGFGESLSVAWQMAMDEIENRARAN